MAEITRSKFVILGGGTGIHPVIKAARQLPGTVTCIVTVADSGGSTGKLRKIFGFPAVGDIRQSLTGLSDSKSNPWVGKLLEYRFPKGEGLQGHTLGNLLLTALQDLTGSTTEATKVATELFKLEGVVLPVTDTSIELEITYEDGSTAVGQHLLNEKTDNPKKIDHISITPAVALNPAAQKAIAEANWIAIGPGDYDDSLLATIILDGVKDAFAATSAKLIYVVNLMTSNTRTNDMSARDHLAGIEKAIGRQVDYVLVNNEPIPQEITEQYAVDRAYPVIDDLADDPRVVRAPLLSETTHEQHPTDTVERSLLRHSSQKLLAVLQPLL